MVEQNEQVPKYSTLGAECQPIHVVTNIQRFQARPTSTWIENTGATNKASSISDRAATESWKNIMYHKL